MSEAAAISRSLGGRRHTGGYLVRCPVPGHGRGRGDRRPSLSIADGDHRLLVQCSAGCDARDVLETLQSLGLITEARKPAPSAHDRKHRTRRVNPSTLKTWREAQPIAGTIAETYLIAHRGLDPTFPPTLRFVPSLFYPPSGLRLPAMIAAVQSPDRCIVATQATYLRPTDGMKAAVSTPRRTSGDLGAGGLRLVPASSVLGLAEGTEDALAAIQLTGCPCWASLGAHRMRRVHIPDQVHELHIFADDDTSGRNAARLTAEHHRAQGCTVVTHYPPKGCKDWGDTTLRPAQEAAA